MLHRVIKKMEAHEEEVFQVEYAFGHLIPEESGAGTLGTTQRITVNLNQLTSIAFTSDNATVWIAYFDRFITAASDNFQTRGAIDRRLRMAVRLDTGWVSTSYMFLTANQAFNELSGLAGGYNEEAPTITQISISGIKNSTLTVTGGTRSESVANDKWYCLNTFSRTNCFWISLAVCLNYKQSPQLLTLDSARQTSGKDLKQNYKKKYGLKKSKDKETEDKMKTTTPDVYQKAAEFRNVKIILYNNLYQVTNTFIPKNWTHKYKTANIMISQNHAIALIPRNDIPKNVKIPEKKIIEERVGFLKLTGEKFNGRNEVFKLNTGHFLSMGREFADLRTLIKYGNDLKMRYHDIKQLDTCSKIEKDLKTASKCPTNIMTMDMECACKVEDIEGGSMVCYLTGFAYHDSFFNVDKCVQFEGVGTCIKESMEWLFEKANNFSDYVCYAHNGGKFDIYFLMNEYLFSDNTKWKISSVLEVEGCIVSLVIETNDSRKVKIKFLDSYKLCPVSLEGLCISLASKTKKLKDMVPHHEITTGNYKNYMNDIYIYHQNDCLSLMECMRILAKCLYADYNLDYTKYYTAPSLAINLFWQIYYRQFEYPIYKLDSHQDSYIRKGFLGGRTEAYSLGNIGKSYYYDRVSLYPDVGRKLLPYGEPRMFSDIQFNDCFVDNKTNHILASFFGFVEVILESTNLSKDTLELPFFGAKYGETIKKLVFAKIKPGSKSIVVFSEAIKYAQQNDLSYKYTYVSAMQFNAFEIMKAFFEDRFKKRKEKKDVGDLAGSMLEKLYMNSAYGKFALRTKDRDSISLYSSGFTDHFQTYHDNELVNIAEKGHYLLIRKRRDIEAKDTNVAISAAITEYARMEMHKMVTIIRKAGGWVHYWDTDSLITDMDITKKPEVFKVLVPDGKGNTLGSLKNEFPDKLEDYFKKCSENDIFWTEPEKIQIRQVAKERGYCMDRGIILGAKTYFLEYDLPYGRKMTMSAFKGLSQRGISLSLDVLQKALKNGVYKPFEGTPDKPVLEPVVYFDDKDELATTHKLVPAGGQLCFQGGKKVIMTETTSDAMIKIVRLKKEFRFHYTKANYTKGESSQRLKPLEIVLK